MGSGNSAIIIQQLKCCKDASSMRVDQQFNLHITGYLDQSALHGGGVGRISGDTVLAIKRAVHGVEGG